MSILKKELKRKDIEKTRPILEKEDKMRVVHLSAHFIRDFVEVNLVVAPPKDINERSFLDYASKKVRTKLGFRSEQELYSEDGSMVKLFYLEHNPIFQHIEKFDLYRHRGYYCNNNIVNSCIDSLIDLYSNYMNYEASDCLCLNPHNVFWRSLDSLQHHWH